MDSSDYDGSHPADFSGWSVPSETSLADFSGWLGLPEVTCYDEPMDWHELSTQHNATQPMDISNDHSSFQPILTSTFNQHDLSRHLSALSTVPSFIENLDLGDSRYSSFSNSSEIIESFESLGSNSEVIGNLQPARPIQVVRAGDSLMFDLDAAIPVDIEEGGNQESSLSLIINGSRTSKNVLVDHILGKTYCLNRVTDKGTMESFRCTCYSSFCKCRARIKMRHSNILCAEQDINPGEENIINLELNKDYWIPEDAAGKYHIDSCPIRPGLKEHILVIRTCKKLALNRENDGRDAQDILNEALVKHTDSTTVTDFFRTHFNIRKMINRFRQTNRARPPRRDGSDLLDFIFVNDRLPDSVPPEFYRGHCDSYYNGAHHRHFVFFTDTQKYILQKATVFVIDATFCVAKPHLQLLVIHTKINLPNDEHSYLPLAFALMSCKSESSYVSVFKHIKNIVESGNVEMNVSEFIVDYEWGLWKSIRRVWPNKVVEGCWFHFCQLVYKRLANECGLKNAFCQKRQVYEMAKRLMTLPLVDFNNIPSLFLHLETKVYSQLIAQSPGVRKLFEYFRTNWIEGTKFTPQDYCCYRRKIRTTNPAESWNNEINRVLGKKKPDIYQITPKLAKNAANSLRDINQFATKTKQKRFQLEKEKLIRDACRKYEKHPEDEYRHWKLLNSLVKATINHIRYGSRDQSSADEEPQT